MKKKKNTKKIKKKKIVNKKIMISYRSRLWVRGYSDSKKKLKKIIINKKFNPCKNVSVQKCPLVQNCLFAILCPRAIQSPAIFYDRAYLTATHFIQRYGIKFMHEQQIYTETLKNTSDFKNIFKVPRCFLKLKHNSLMQF